MRKASGFPSNSAVSQFVAATVASLGIAASLCICVLVRLGSSRPAPTEVPADGPLRTLLVGATAAWTRGLPALRTRGLLARPQDARGGMNGREVGCGVRPGRYGAIGFRSALYHTGL